MNASFSYSSLSNTITCSQCSKTLTKCQCSPASFTSNLSNVTTTSNNTGIYTSGGGLGYQPFQFTCSGCGNNINSCTCSYTLQPTPLIQPITQPAPYWQHSTTWTTLTSTPVEYIKDFLVRAIQTPEEYKTKGSLQVLHFDKADGLYLKGESLSIPIEYKECFYQLRKTGGYNLFQLRSPLSFRIDLSHDEQPQKQPHFFTLVDIEGFAANKENTLVDITTPFLQEITDQLELIRLVEIQDTFTKLLRRL